MDDPHGGVRVNIYSGACLIDEGDSFLLTGAGAPGPVEYKKAPRYSSDSWLQDLDDLNTGRFGHACGWYIDSSGKRVRSISISMFSAKYLQ